jgi:hypothetical protein
MEQIDMFSTKFLAITTALVLATLAIAPSAHAAKKLAYLPCTNVASINGTTLYTCKGNVVYVFVKNSDVWVSGNWRAISVNTAAGTVVVQNIATNAKITITPQSNYGIQQR